MVEKIVSGGQTGADRAGLDWAIEHGVKHGGWCPLGRRASDGPLDRKYRLKETDTEGYLKRTRWNVRDADATVVFTLGAVATGGSGKTLLFAKGLKRPFLHVHAGMADPVGELVRFIESPLFAFKVLNVAGSSEGKEPGVYEWTRKVLEGALVGRVKMVVG